MMRSERTAGLSLRSSRRFTFKLNKSIAGALVTLPMLLAALGCGGTHLPDAAPAQIDRKSVV